jgi:hypothetical protein
VLASRCSPPQYVSGRCAVDAIYLDPLRPTRWTKRYSTLDNNLEAEQFLQAIQINARADVSLQGGTIVEFQQDGPSAHRERVQESDNPVNRGRRGHGTLTIDVASVAGSTEDGEHRQPQRLIACESGALRSGLAAWRIDPPLTSRLTS